MTNAERATIMARLVMSSGKHQSNISKKDVQDAYDVSKLIETEIEERDRLAIAKVSKASPVQGSNQPTSVMPTMSGFVPVKTNSPSKPS
jgi:hypothetical protein